MGEDAAGSHEYVVAQVVGRGAPWPATGGHLLVAAVEPSQLKRQQFPHVPQRHRRPLEFVEHSAVDQPERVSADRRCPSPRWPAEHGVSLEDTPVISGDNPRMKAKSYPEAFQFGPDRPELWFIEVAPEDVVVVQDSLESEVRHSPAQLDHGGVGILQWQ